jgi:hypothetical protein
MLLLVKGKKLRLSFPTCCLLSLPHKMAKLRARARIWMRMRMRMTTMMTKGPKTQI